MKTKTKTTEKYSDGSWEKYHYNDRELKVRHEDSNGHWCKYTYNDQGLEIRREDSNGHWKTYDYNDQGELINTKRYEKETKTEKEIKLDTKLETVISLLRRIISNT